MQTYGEWHAHDGEHSWLPQDCVLIIYLRLIPKAWSELLLPLELHYHYCMFSTCSWFHLVLNNHFLSWLCTNSYSAIFYLRSMHLTYKTYKKSNNFSFVEVCESVIMMILVWGMDLFWHIFPLFVSMITEPIWPNVCSLPLFIFILLMVIKVAIARQFFVFLC